MYVYKIINCLNRKSYIGITNNIEERFQYHKTRFDKECKKEYREKPLYKAFRKYGIENFKFLILYKGLTLQEAKDKEVELIKKFKTLTHENGYNITKGGDWRSNEGENNNTTILTEADVLQIRELVGRGENIKNIYNINIIRIKLPLADFKGFIWDGIGSILVMLKRMFYPMEPLLAKQWF